jgi:hypothetical protein
MVRIFEKMERKLGVKWFGGGSAALLYFERRVRWRSCDKLEDPPHQHSCMGLSCDAFSSEALICWRTGNAWAVDFSIRNPLAGDSMKRSLHQTLSELTIAMAHAWTGQCS